MRNEPVREVPFTAAEVAKILAVCSPQGLLVGGQALAFWAGHLNVSPPAGLSSGITLDVDFIGDAALAKTLGKSLGWKTWIPDLDDASPQTGKVTRLLRNGGIKQIDFLSGVAGLTSKDLTRRAVELRVPGIGRLRVIHPIDVLDSRIQNLHLLPAKRTPAGIAQGYLAVDVARAFIQNQVESRSERVALKLLERVAEIAAEIAAIRVFVLYGIDPLAAVPIASFNMTPLLHRQRWPQIRAAVSRKRTALRKQQGGRSSKARAPAE